MSSSCSGLKVNCPHESSAWVSRAFTSPCASRTSGTGGGTRGTQRSLRRLLREEQPDLVHSNDLPTHQLVSQAAGKLAIPRICHHRWIFGRVAIDWLNKFGAERHLFVSQALKDQLCGESERLAKLPCEVVYDGLPLPKLPTPHERADSRCHLGLPPEKVIVTYAGQIVPRKGVADLLQAWMIMDPEWARPS